jgi:hypothetical protein
MPTRQNNHDCSSEYIRLACFSCTVNLLRTNSIVSSVADPVGSRHFKSNTDPNLKK